MNTQNTSPPPSSKLKFTSEHFRISDPDVAARVLPVVAEGIQRAMQSDDVRSFAKLNRQEVEYLASDMPMIRQGKDLDSLATSLRGSREFGFSPLFCPKLVDDCCVRGIFPMTLEVKRGVFVFAPKLHVTRGIVRLRDEPLPGIIFHEEGECVFQPNRMMVKRALIRKVNIFINRREDISEALQLMFLQHSENWLCEPLRACFVYMLLHPQEFTTQIVLFVMRAKSVVDAAEPILSAELGFIVGGVYTSATGAYRASGCGTLQLAALGLWLRRSPLKVWDLGMLMDYKEKSLGCSGIPRKKWMALIGALQQKEACPTWSVTEFPVDCQQLFTSERKSDRGASE